MSHETWVRSFDISPKFTLFRRHTEVKPGVKMGKNFPINCGINVIFVAYFT